MDDHRHVSRLVLVLPHHLMRGRDLVPREHFAHAGIDATIEQKLVGGRSLLEMREMRALPPLLSHPDIASVEGDVVAGSAGAEDDHPASLDDQARYRKRLLTGMLEHDIGVTLAGDIPDRL